MTEPTPIRIHVALDSRLMREAVAEALRREDGFRVVDATAEGSAGLKATSGLETDVVVFAEPADEELCGAVARYRNASRGSKVVLLAMASRAVDLGECGADAVMDAGDGVGELAVAIRRVMRAT